MKRTNITRVSRGTHSVGETDWARVDAKTDADIEADMRSDPDWADDLEIDWSTAFVGLPPAKEAISIRLDADVVDFFRKSGKGYQTRVNAILRHYMNETRRKSEG